MDRVAEITCPHCAFSFYLRNLQERPAWTCPSCGNAIDMPR
ncbi:hypothetical protein B4168_3368 [Anoxybacillus flavithermus]|nr:hypothetical protein B4168_3368 [Anoxybacillus flavithermus]OAO85060.1 hypothetical protein GT23_3114 [Parageobacillus thermoglucosidasius]